MAPARRATASTPRASAASASLPPSRWPTRSTRSSTSASPPHRQEPAHERDRPPRRDPPAPHPRRAGRGVPHAARGQPRLRALRRDLLLDRPDRTSIVEGKSGEVLYNLE